MKISKFTKKIFQLKKEEGFSFIKLLIVIVIIATLSGIIGFAYTRWINSSRNSATLASLETIKKAVQTYQLENNSFPANLEQIKDRLAGNVKLVDAWGKPFKMEKVTRDGKVFLRIYSSGKDGQDNTSDDIEVLLQTDETSAAPSGSGEENR